MTSAARIRVILDNDWSGDPDGLFQLAHHALSPSADIRVVSGSHLRPQDGWAVGDRTAEDAAEAAQRVLDACGRSEIRAVAGSNVAMPDAGTPADSRAARAIVEEAMRDDPRPLYACFGGPLTALASALLIEPRIADRLTLVWIGGVEYPGVAAPPDPSPIEYNMHADIPSAMTVFNDFPVRIWQVPRNSYRYALMTQAELDRRVRPLGPLGGMLAGSIDRIRDLLTQAGRSVGESYIYGDSPLVLLTVLQAEFEPDPSSSDSVVRPAPTVREDGSFDFDAPGRDIRVFDRLDTRLLFEDLFAKLEAFAAR